MAEQYVLLVPKGTKVVALRKTGANDVATTAKARPLQLEAEFSLRA